MLPAAPPLLVYPALCGSKNAATMTRALATGTYNGLDVDIAIGLLLEEDANAGLNCQVSIQKGSQQTSVLRSREARCGFGSTTG
jgi:hypothetical protein